MGKFMGDGFNSLSFVQRIDDPDNGLLEGKANSCGRVFFPTPMLSPVSNHLYPDTLYI
jgi:uncharacterized OB-fold protein